MKKSSFLFGVVFFLGFLVYLFFSGWGWNGSSSTLSAVHTSTLYLDSMYLENVWGEDDEWLFNRKFVGGVFYERDEDGYWVESSSQEIPIGYPYVLEEDVWMVMDGEYNWDDYDYEGLVYDEDGDGYNLIIPAGLWIYGADGYWHWYENEEGSDYHVDDPVDPVDNPDSGDDGGGSGSDPISTPIPTSVPVNGDCSAVTGQCLMGTATTVAAQAVSTGVNNIWVCLGSNGGSTDICSSVNCTNGSKVDGMCQSGVAGCHSGTLSYNSSDANGDYINDSNESEYIWDCVGSSNTCAEGDGSEQLGCVATIDQDNWFQVNNGNVLAKGVVTNYVPITAVNGTGGYSSTVNNGKVYSKYMSSLSDYDQSGKTEESSFNFKTYGFNQIKADYFDTKGVGTTFAGGVSWTTVKNTTGVIFVDGDLEINEDLVTTNFVMIVAKGTITIDANVNEVDAILVADKVVAVAAADSVASVSQLVINGMVHGVSGVEFSRSLVPKSLNNTLPSVKVNYNSELLFMIPQELAKSFSQWKVN